MASRCGHSASSTAARASMAKGELSGKAMAANSSGLPLCVTARLAKKNTSTCAIVTGIDRVCTSRTVAAIDPTARNTDPSKR